MRNPFALTIAIICLMMTMFLVLDIVESIYTGTPQGFLK